MSIRCFYLCIRVIFESIDYYQFSIYLCIMAITLQ